MANDIIAEAMGIPPLPATQIDDKKLPVAVEAPSKEEVIKDFNYVRDNMYKVSEMGIEALEEMIEIAKQSQNARAFEVVAILMGQISSVNKDMLDHQQKVREIIEVNEESKSSVGKIEANNVIFTGTTAELTSQLGHTDVRDLLRKKPKEPIDVEGEVVDGETVEEDSGTETSRET